MAVVLYGFWRSLATYRVRAALNLKGIDYTDASSPWARASNCSLLTGTSIPRVPCPCWNTTASG